MDDLLPSHDKLFNLGDWWRSSSSYFVLGAVLLMVVAAVFIWALAIRKREDRYTSHRQHLRHHHSSSSNEKPKTDSNSQNGHGRKRRKRRSAHPHYPKNPTLAETGGLPPIRQSPPPSRPPTWSKD